MDSATDDEISIAIRPGTSVGFVEAAFKTFNHSVCFKLQIENYTSFDLIYYDHNVFKGYVTNPPTIVESGEMELMAGHNDRWTGKGIQGLAIWSVGDTGKIVSIMYSIPYNITPFNRHKSWYAIGIHNKPRINRMYGSTDIRLIRSNGKRIYHTKAVKYSDHENRFTIRGIMGTETINILLTASNIEERAVGDKCC